MTHRFNLALVALALLLGLPYYWYFIDNSAPNAPPHQIEIAQLRQLAASIPGAAPRDVEVECAGFRRVPGNFMVAGSGIKRKLICYMAFQLPVPGGKPIVIESGIASSDARAIGAEEIFPQAQHQIAAALDRAGLILVTHEHRDHLGALVSHGGPALAKAAALNPRQVPPAPTAAMLDWSNGPVPAPRLPANRMVAIAPGVVVIPAPDSHTSGSQMIFVRLGDGREFLFAGDISSFAQNWQEQRGRSRFLETWVAAQNRGDVFAWLQAIARLKQSAPGLVVVPGHDFEWLTNQENNSTVKLGFTAAGS